MISKEFTAYERRPSISDTCIVIHFNQIFLKTQGNHSVPLKITFFFIMFTLFFVFREKNMWYNQGLFLFYCIFTFIFKERIFKAAKKKKEAVFIKCQLLAHIYMKPCIHSKVIITLPILLMKKLKRCTSICLRSHNQWVKTGWCLSSHLSKYKIQSPSMISHDLQLLGLKQSVLYFSIFEKVFQGFWDNLRLFTAPQKSYEAHIPHSQCYLSPFLNMT